MECKTESEISTGFYAAEDLLTMSRPLLILEGWIWNINVLVIGKELLVINNLFTFDMIV